MKSELERYYFLQQQEMYTKSIYIFKDYTCNIILVVCRGKKIPSIHTWQIEMKRKTVCLCTATPAGQIRD